MNAKISVFVVCVEVTICLLLYNLHDCTFKLGHRCYLFHVFKEVLIISRPNKDN